MASFDGNGLVIDRLADIKTQMQEGLRSVYGDGINLAETSPWGVLIGILSERYSLLWETVEAIYQASFVNTAFGIYLDELVALNGIVRDEATASTVVLTFTRSNGINDGDVLIPTGTQVTDPDSTSGLVWETNSNGTIPDGLNTADVLATANATGPLGALPGTLTNMVAIPTNVLSVTNAADAILGANEESDSELKLRRVFQLGRSGTSTEAGIISALTNMDEIRTATLVLNDTDFTDGDGRPPHSFEAYVSPETEFNLGQISTLVADAPLVAGNSIALELNSSPIAGSPVAFTTDNDTTMALIAAAFEAETEIESATVSDAGDTITLQASSEMAFTASAVVTGGASQANFAFSTPDPADGTIDAVGQTIWDSKSAGIQTHGNFSATVTDTAGDLHTVNFSKIDDVEVFVRLTLTINADYVAGTSEPAIQEAIAAYSVSDLLPGVDVLNYKIASVVSQVNVAGLEGIVVDFSTTSTGGPWDPANIDIDTFEFATITTSDVVFVYIGP